ncbi:hypothetical protein FQN49_007542 [Arthroderma sp. PD_2]|nr:hypothetical protein FQN49_007542 [Arthroderma sp. PD_2]
MPPYYADDLDDYYPNGLNGISHMMQPGYYDYYDGSDEEYAMPLPHRRQRIQAKTIILMCPIRTKPATTAVTTTITIDSAATETAVGANDQAMGVVQTLAVKKSTTITS